VSSPTDERAPTVVLVDDAADVRLLVRMHLAHAGRFDVVAEGSDGLEAIDLAREHQPTLLVLDVSMPRMDGLEALPRIREVAPQTKVVMYTGFEEQGLARRAQELGASALIEKSMAVEGLSEQLWSVAHSDTTAEPPAPTPAPPDTAAGSARNVLDEHRERFREVFDEAAIGMATMTLAGHIVRANRALAALVGRDMSELVGTAYADLAFEADAPAAAEAVRAAQQGEGAVVRFEHRVAGGDESRWLLATAAPVRDTRRRPLYLFLQSQDVTAQRHAEEELRQSEVRFRLLVEAVEDYAIFMLDRTGHVLSWNSGAQRIKGYSADDIIGQHFRVFYPEHLQTSKHPEHELEIALRVGHYEEEGWRIRKDGTRFWANVLITTVRDRAGEHIGFAKVTRNVEERRQMLLDLEGAAHALAATNRELESANARLAQDAADRAQFLAVTAHELRSPVGVLSGSANLLVEHWDELESAERTDLFHSITLSSRRLQRLLRDLLTASRLESNSLELHGERVEVAALLDRTIRAAQALTPGAEILLDVPPGLAVHAEPERLAQVVDNLLLNGLRHGTPPVQVSARTVGDRVEITVADAGSGVPEGVRPRLFQRFATGSPTGGTGLGLFIVRELARALGGDAFYYPPEGSAPTRFVLSLPVEPPVDGPRVQ
jgi:hypothetical protein